MNDVESELDAEVSAKKSVRITVTADPLDFTPWVYFWMEAEYPGGGGKKVGENLKFDKRKGGFEMTFSLVDNTGLSLAFYRDFADAIWVARGPKCPTQAGDGGAITPVSVAEKELIVTNANDLPELLTFALRFRGNASDGAFPPYVYDPKIINGGGTNLL